jgi:hypothetical protein
VFGWLRTGAHLLRCGGVLTGDGNLATIAHRPARSAIIALPTILRLLTSIDSLTCYSHKAMSHIKVLNLYFNRCFNLRTAHPFTVCAMNRQMHT